MVTADISITLDGYGSGLNQSRELPFGDTFAVKDWLHPWMFAGIEQHQRWVDDIVGKDAYIMGRKMFDPVPAWDLDWTGWWGEDPPYHGPVYILTHHERESVEMQGGTTFHFVTGGTDEAMRLARDAAGPDGSISICGGPGTINQYLAKGLIDELRLHVVPVVAGAGERLLTGIGTVEFEQVEVEGSDLVTHIRLRPKR